MFNFIAEIKDKIKGAKEEVFDNYHVINLSGKAVYVEGHCGLDILSKEQAVFRVKNGTIEIDGKNLTLAELSENTMLICGEIYKLVCV